MKQQPKRTILVDGDIVVYQVAAATETSIRWNDGLWTVHADENAAQAMVDQRLAEYMDVLKADDMIIALSDATSFRYDVYPQYKSNRKGKRPPLLRAHLKSYVLANYKTFLRPGLEGDDVLGILATSPVIVKSKEKIIVSEDKDMRTVPGLYCNFKKFEEQGILTISENEAAYRHMTQTLTGDTTDGYPGCPGYGPKTAEKLLGDDPEQWSYSVMWPKVTAAYVKKGLSSDVALQMARIARICQRDDYDYERKEVILWTPPTTIM